MPKRYKKRQSCQNCPNLDKDSKMTKRTNKEKKMPTKNLERRLRLAKKHRRTKYREEKRREEKIDSRESSRQINMIYDKNGFYEDENKSMNFLISKGMKDNEMKEKKINIEKYNNKNKKIKNIITIIELIIIINIITILPSNRRCLIEYNFSNITLKIKGTGIKNILGKYDSFNYFDSAYFPKEVYINGELQNSVKYSYNFNQTHNFVELIYKILMKLN